MRCGPYTTAPGSCCPLAGEPRGAHRGGVPCPPQPPAPPPEGLWGKGRMLGVVVIGSKCYCLGCGICVSDVSGSGSVSGDSVRMVEVLMVVLVTSVGVVSSVSVVLV